jgi:hypothetical protein
MQNTTLWKAATVSAMHCVHFTISYELILAKNEYVLFEIWVNLFTMT